MITLDLKPQALLDFSKGRHEALVKIAKGEPVCFYLDLGLSGLKPHEIPSVALALDHFFETIGTEFKAHIKEIILYKGPFPEDDALFAGRLRQATAKVAASVDLILDFESGSLKPLSISKKCSRSLYSRFEVRVDGQKPPFTSPEAHVGFLLPSDYEEVFYALVERGVDLRVVEEAYLIADWHGLDYLLVDPKYLDKEALRKLKGFAAAAGAVISLGEKIGVENEIAFDREMLFNHR